MYTSIHKYIYVYIHTYICVCVFVCVCVCVCGCVCVCVLTNVCISNQWSHVSNVSFNKCLAMPDLTDLTSSLRVIIV